MGDEEGKRDIRLSIRMTEKEMNALTELQEWLQKRAPLGIRITQKIVIVQALDLLWKRRDELDRKR